MRVGSPQPLLTLLQLTPSATRTPTQTPTPTAHTHPAARPAPPCSPAAHGERLKKSGFIIPQEVPPHSWLRRGVGPPPNRYNIKPVGGGWEDGMAGDGWAGGWWAGGWRRVRLAYGPLFRSPPPSSLFEPCPLGRKAGATSWRKVGA